MLDSLNIAQPIYFLNNNDVILQLDSVLFLLPHLHTIGRQIFPSFFKLHLFNRFLYKMRCLAWLYNNHSGSWPSDQFQLSINLHNADRSRLEARAWSEGKLLSKLT